MHYVMHIETHIYTVVCISHTGTVTALEWLCGKLPSRSHKHGGAQFCGGCVTASDLWWM